jgi:hypothetical protein
MLLKINLDDQTANRLVEMAARELRPAHWQAEVMLMRILGTWKPPEYYSETEENKPSSDGPSFEGDQGEK